MEKNYNPTKFVIVFLLLFLVFYWGNLGFWGVVTPGKSYSPFLDHYLNYIAGLRWLLIKISVTILDLFGYTAVNDTNEILVAGHGKIIVAYSCLGLGVMSFLAAFVIAYPKPFKAKLLFLCSAIFTIQVLNVCRLVLLALFWDKRKVHRIDHHDIFNVFIYIVIAISLYFWVKAKHRTTNYAAN